MEKITDFILTILSFIIIICIAVWVFLSVVVPASNKFLYNKVQYVPFCPDDPNDIPEGIELDGEMMLL